MITEVTGPTASPRRTGVPGQAQEPTTTASGCSSSPADYPCDPALRYEEPTKSDARHDHPAPRRPRPETNLEEPDNRRLPHALITGPLRNRVSRPHEYPSGGSGPSQILGAALTFHVSYEPAARFSRISRMNQRSTSAVNVTDGTKVIHPIGLLDPAPQAPVILPKEPTAAQGPTIKTSRISRTPSRDSRRTR